eukprot:6361091-Pyramimonas_sp.AAC.1
MRGCFEKEALTKRQIGEWDPINPAIQSRLEFQYQIPRFFDVFGSITKHARAQYQLLHNMLEQIVSSNLTY